MTATIRTYRGDSIPIAQALKLTPSNVVIGDTFTVLCNNKPISYVAQASTAADVVNGLTAALIANAQAIPEFTEFTASAFPAGTPGPSDGSFILLTANTPGVPFAVTVTTQVTSAGNVTVAETTPGKFAVNEVHSIALVGTYTGGTFTLTYSFGTTSAIAYNATAATVQAALAALAGVGAGQVIVTGGPGPNSPWFVTWTGSLAGTAVATGTINGASLTGSAGITVTETTRGNGLSNCIQRVSVCSATAGTFTLTLNGQTTSALNWNATPAQVQTALQALPNVGAGNALVFGVAAVGATNPNNGYFWVLFTGALAGVNVAQLVINIGNLVASETSNTGIQQVGGQTTADEFQVIDLGGATSGTFTLTYNGVTSNPINIVGQNNTNGQTDTPLAINVELRTIAGSGPSDTGFDVVIGQNDFSSLAETNFLVHFRGAHANTAFNLLTVNGGGLTGSSGATVTRLSAGHANVNEVWSIYTNAAGGTFTLTLNSQTTAATAFNATTGTLQTNIQTAFTNSLTTVTVSGSGTLAAPWVVTVTNPADTPLGPPTGNGALLTGGGGVITELTHGAAGVNEVQTVTIAAGATGGTFTLAFNGAVTGGIAWNASAATVQGQLTGLSTINTVTVSGSAGGPYTVTWSGAQGSSPEPLLVANGSGITGITGSQTLAVATQTASAGPNHYNDPLNWTGDVVPSSNEAIVFDPSSSPCLYGLNQINTFSWNTGTNLGTWAAADLVTGQGVYLTTTNTLPAGLSANTLYYLVNVNRDAGTFQLALTPGGTPITVTTTGTGVHTVGVRLASIEFSSRYTGQIGNPRKNSLGYIEYRALYLHVGMQSIANGGLQTVTIGTGQGSGAGKIQLDNDVDQAAVKVINTGGSAEPGVAAFLWKGQNTSNTLALLNGDVGIAPFPGETAALGATAPAAALIQRAGTLEIGGGVSITGPIDKTGGLLTSDNASINGACLLRQ